MAAELHGAALPRGRAAAAGTAAAGGWRASVVPVAVVVAVVLVLWYAAAVALNAGGSIERDLAPRGPWRWTDLVAATWSQQRPLLPAPHQIARELWSGVVDWPVDSPRNLLLHVAVTAQTTLVGFAMGALLGLLLAAGIVQSRSMERALLPWIVASQAVPVLALAPIVLVVLGTLGLGGVLPKAVIAMLLCFFPVTVAMVQGLRAPQASERELMRTYGASGLQTFWLLRVPASLPFLFPALRVAMAAGLVGAMVAELPTGAQAGLGARLLTGSYYGNTLQIWAALVLSAVLGLALTAAVGGVERLALRHRRGPAGGRPA